MSETKNTQDLNWIYSVLGAGTGALTVYAVSGSILYSLLGALVGLVFGAILKSFSLKKRNH